MALECGPDNYGEIRSLGSIRASITRQSINLIEKSVGHRFGAVSGAFGRNSAAAGLQANDEPKFVITLKVQRSSPMRQWPLGLE